MEKKKTPVIVLILGILLAAGVVVALIFGVKALVNKKDPAASTEPVSTGETVDPTATEPTDPEIIAARTKTVYTEEEIATDDSRLDETVAECGDYSLTSHEAQIYYGMQFVSFMNNYGSYAEYFGLDTTKALKDQASMVEGLTWEQYFLMSGMKEFQEYAAVATASKAAGYNLPEEEQADLESFLSGMEKEAAAYGFESVDAYLQDSFGTSVRYEDYETYLRLYFQAMSYENSIYLSVNPTDEDLQTYLDAHSDEFADTDMEAQTVDVRHILISYDRDDDGKETDAEKAEAKTKAEELLAEYEADPTEEHFADLANLNSEDTGSNTKGGLYEGISQETNFVEPFKNWCLDSARQVGDTGIVETTYGYHVMYFVGSDFSWKSTARHNIRMAHTDDWVDGITGDCPVTIHYENVVLCTLPMATTEAE